jgi:hypothetical protein
MTNVFAEDVPYHLKCTASDLKTSIELTSTKGRMVFVYTNYDGKDFFPLYNGVVTTKNLANIKAAKKLYADSFQTIEFSWPIEECIVSDTDSLIVKCLKNAEVKYPINTKVKTSSFQTSINTEQTFNFSYEKLNVRFILNAQDKNFEISIPIQKDRCQLGL